MCDEFLSALLLHNGMCVCMHGFIYAALQNSWYHTLLCVGYVSCEWVVQQLACRCDVGSAQCSVVMVDTVLHVENK